MDRLGFGRLLGSRPCPEADRVCAMVAARVLEPHTKLATTRWWRTCTLAEDLGVGDATEDDLYAAMDWLLARQGRIQQKLAARHLAEGGLVLYDLSSTYFEGTTCPLAKRGHNRDGVRDKLQVNFGLITNAQGCPVAVDVMDGNVADPTTLMPQVHRLRETFGIRDLVVVGDRGMIAQKAITELQTLPGVAWITALKTAQIRALLGTPLQLGLFDDRDLVGFTHPDYPGERLVACRNPALAARRAQTRQSLIDATIVELEKVRGMVARGRLTDRGDIGVRVGKVINKYHVAKHFSLTIADRRFAYARRTARITAEAALDGIYVIRTSVPEARLSDADTVRAYKSLSQVERAFRTLKRIDLHVRPIHHRLADRVRSHIFLCVLAYYVEWHMREAWRPLLFADEDLAAKATRDPVAPAHRSPAADEKAATHRTTDGAPVHSFRTLLSDLTTLVRNHCRTRSAPDAPIFAVTTTATPAQRHALDLLNAIA
jgi:transposase